MANWLQVSSVSECPEGELRGVVAEGQHIVLADVEGTIYALRDQCSHEEYPLSDGELDGDEIVCVYHGARFNACTGARKTLPAVLPIKSFPIEVREGDIYVDVT